MYKSQVVRKALPADVKEKFPALIAGMGEQDQDCLYGIASGETAGFKPVTHDAYNTIIAVREAELEQGGN